MKGKQIGRDGRTGGGYWKEKGACRTLTPGQAARYFYPTGNSNPFKRDIQAGKDICANCPVRDECLLYALREREDYGTWGGVDEWERREMRSSGRIEFVIEEVETGSSHDPAKEYLNCKLDDGKRCRSCRTYIQQMSRRQVKLEKVCESCEKVFKTSFQRQRFHTPGCRKRNSRERLRGKVAISV